MNNIVSNFGKILEEAEKEGLPREKRRGILREYLQVKFLSGMYRRPAAKKLSFIGGTSLRLLHGIGRFSEDLDFDNLGLKSRELTKLIDETAGDFIRENIKIEVSGKLREGIIYHALRFPDLLFDLKISTDPREKLMVKVDYSNNWRRQKPETALLSKFGFIEQIITNPLAQTMAQKLAAYVNRAKTQPRDMFDIVWLFSRQVRPDREFMRANRMGDVVERAKEKFAKEGATEMTARRLRPFLFDEKEISKIKLLGEVLIRL